MIWYECANLSPRSSWYRKCLRCASPRGCGDWMILCRSVSYSSMTTYTVSSAMSTMMSLSEMTLGCLPSQRHRRSSRSVCLPSVGEAHMGVIFFMATLEPVCTFLQATTMP
jgi:hypothetical protein